MESSQSHNESRSQFQFEDSGINRDVTAMGGTGMN